MEKEKQMSESLRIGIILAVSGGFMDAYSYLCRDQVFANAQTGNMLLLGVNLAERNLKTALQYFCPVLAFIIGIILSDVIRHKWEEISWFHWRQISVLLEAVILFGVAFVPKGMSLPANSLISLACGIQVESFRKVHGNGIATTMCIGNLRSGTQNFCEYFWNKKRENLRKGLLYYGIIGCFVLGAVIGSVVIANLQEKAILICSGILFAAFLLMFRGSGRQYIKGGRMKKIIAVCFLAAAVSAFLIGVGRKGKERESTETFSDKSVVHTESTDKPKETKQPVQTASQEEGIYTFLQGPKSWERRLKWSGEWGVTFYDGGSFGGFGCGLCCIANIYSSLTKYQCTPVDAYRYAKKKTDYAGGGAIDWGYMRQSLSSLGFDCGVAKKPDSYEAFRKEIAAGQSAIVLVSSAESKCYWKNTPGHYVTIFLYDEKKDRVFLADSGDPEHNGQWISLRKIYKSLKTASTWQYLLVKDYDEEADQWKHKKAEGNWVRD